MGLLGPSLCKGAQHGASAELPPARRLDQAPARTARRLAPGDSRELVPGAHNTVRVTPGSHCTRTIPLILHRLARRGTVRMKSFSQILNASTENFWQRAASRAPVGLCTLLAMATAQVHSRVSASSETRARVRVRVCAPRGRDATCRTRACPPQLNMSTSQLLTHQHPRDHATSLY